MINLKRFRTIFRPPKAWRLIVTILLGIFTGIFLFILHAAKATSYLSDDPRACVNCHVMAPQFATWERGSHGKVTNCNDCHVPQDNILNKYFFKASDGLRHSFMFTFRLEPQVIQIKEAGKKAVQQNCRSRTRKSSDIKKKDEYTCTQGKQLKFEKEKLNTRGRKTRYYRGNECSGCPVKKQCTTSNRGRIKIRYVNQDFRDNYRVKMKEKESKEKIRLRKTIIEHPIGTIKLWFGKNPLLLRGIEKVKTEIRLVSFSYNLLRIFNIDGFEKLTEKIDKYNWKLA